MYSFQAHELEEKGRKMYSRNSKTCTCTNKILFQSDSFAAAHITTKILQEQNEVKWLEHWWSGVKSSAGVTGLNRFQLISTRLVAVTPLRMGHMAGKLLT